jgi:tRNA pseudouridine38-40 synthase
LRYFLEIAYNGKNFHGWQNQPDAISVQEKIEEALSTLLRTKIEIVGAGRTDAGVHAKQLFAHFDYNGTASIDNLIFRLNSYLPKTIAILDFFPVKADAHARFDALSRTYEYVISMGKDPFSEDFAYQLQQQPDVEAMNEAAKILLQHNDFQCFSRSKTDVKTYFCKIYEAYWTEKEKQLIFTITADRFLRNMVRAIVGTLLDVGFHKIAVAEMHSIIASKKRSNAGTSVPANGLYLTKITYPDNLKITHG